MNERITWSTWNTEEQEMLLRFIHAFENSGTEFLKRRTAGEKLDDNDRLIILYSCLLETGAIPFWEIVKRDMFMVAEIAEHKNQKYVHKLPPRPYINVEQSIQSAINSLGNKEKLIQLEKVSIPV